MNRVIFTAHKWSLGQGNVSTPVCMFTGGLTSQHASQVTLPGVSASRGVCIQGILHQGGLHPEGLHPGDLHPEKPCIQGPASSWVCIQRGVLHLEGSTYRRSASGEVGQTPPLAVQDMVNKWVVCILLEWTIVNCQISLLILVIYFILWVQIFPFQIILPD